ncbi:MAG: hypothetical protein J6X55_11460 [Victivallales bacterium]|nr:hypothetical protein [Victivallales bacterium]
MRILVETMLILGLCIAVAFFVGCRKKVAVHTDNGVPFTIDTQEAMLKTALEIYDGLPREDRPKFVAAIMKYSCSEEGINPLSGLTGQQIIALCSKFPKGSGYEQSVGMCQMLQSSNESGLRSSLSDYVNNYFRMREMIEKNK